MARLVIAGIIAAPAGLPHGRYDLRVVADGIASHEVEVRVF